MARPSPVPATTGARDISNLVPGGYIIRPYEAESSNPGGSRESVRAAIQAAPTRGPKAGP